ncbi:baculoviral IAP repeat-containing protein 1-like [Ptychodera flava]|uniref:baculoviral IAP repeat-containing protein 1-like n=1 Tax=Ptychodera flava TaxID=63121 RepID=UPI00396A4BF3
MAEFSAEAAEASAQPQDPGSISSHERSEEQTNEHEDTMNTSEIPPASELALVTCTGTSAEPIGISETPSNRTDMVPVSENTDEKGVSRPSVQMGVHGHENITIAAGDHCTIHLPHSKESQPVTRTDGAEQASHGEDPLAGEAQKCERELRDIYEKDLSNFQTLPWLVGKAIDSVYAEVSLQLKHYEKYSPFDKKDLFTTNKDYRDPRRILIEGDPGYGKTTFCLKFAYDWARHQASFLSHIKLLFYLRLRHFTGDIIDLIVDSLLPKGFKIDKEKLKEYIESNQDKVLFVLDGLDEMKQETKCVSNDVEQMLRGQLFRRCKVIATSQTRSLRLKDLLEEEYTWHFHRSLSLVGFERNYGSDFVNKFTLRRQPG